MYNKKFFFALIVFYFIFFEQIVGLIFLDSFFLNSTAPGDIGTFSDYLISSKYMGGNIESFNYPMGGNVKWYHHFAILKPITFIFIIFQEYGYLILGSLSKILTFFGFYLIGKKNNLKGFNLIIPGLVCVYLSPFHYFFDFGFSIIPYLFYIAVYKEKINTKHYLIVFFAGLNSIFFYILIPAIILLLLILIYNYREEKIKNMKIFFIFLISSLITELNFIIPILDGFEVRTGIITSEKNFTEIMKTFLQKILMIDLNYFTGNKFIFELFLKISIPLTILIGVFNINKNNVKKIILFFIILGIVEQFSYHRFFLDLMTALKLNALNLNYKIGLIKFFIIPFLLLKILRYPDTIILKTNRVLLILFIIIYPLKNTTILIKNYFKFNIKENTNSVYIDSLKKKYTNRKFLVLFAEILKNKNFIFSKTLPNSFDLTGGEMHTYRTLFLSSEYKILKKIIKNERVLLVNLNPSVAAVNEIYVIGGYYNIYPEYYKKEFRKIIDKNDNKSQLNLFDTQSTHLLISGYGADKLDYTQAKKLGANYVLTNVVINNTQLINVCKNCLNSSYQLTMFNLYKIM